MRDRTPCLTVTGVGLVTALAQSVADTWNALARGRSGITALRPAVGGCLAGATIAGLAPPTDLRVPKHAKFMGRAAVCGVRAMLDAVAAAGLRSSGLEPAAIGVYTGTGETGLDAGEFFPALDHAWQRDPSLDFRHVCGSASKLVDPYFSLRTLSNGTAALSAIELPAHGPSINFVQGATASAHALACACDDLEEQKIAAAVVIGCDALVTTASLLAYTREGLLSPRPPDDACKPFSAPGDGFVLGEAAAAVVLESDREARARGACRLGTVRGVGFAATPGGGPGAIDETDEFDACVRAISAAGGSDDAGCVFAFGDPTPRGGQVELACLASAFGRSVPVTTLTGALGYVGAATSLVQVAVALHSLAAGVPAAVRAGHQGRPTAIDLVLGAPRAPHAGRTTVCLARSFAAEHAALVVAEAAP